MTFDCITQDKNLWAVRYDGDSDNILYRLFDQWDDQGKRTNHEPSTKPSQRCLFFSSS